MVPPSPEGGRSLPRQVAGWLGAHLLLRDRHVTGHHFLSVSALFICWEKIMGGKIPDSPNKGPQFIFRIYRENIAEMELYKYTDHMVII